MSGGTALEQEEIERIFYGFAIQAQKQLSAEIEKPKDRVIILSGPTGVGKTSFAIDLAKKIRGEIVSADSMQVYKGMDIGTAKASPEELNGIAQHLIDIREVKDSFNVVDYYYEARHCCQQIIARDRVPIIVGGTGFYLRSLIYGPPGGPPSVPELRKIIHDEVEERGIDEMFKKLKEFDPEYAATITKNDKQKIIRALEIIRLTGEKVSDLAWVKQKIPRNYDFRCWFLYRPRESIYKRIDKRCDKMVEEGFLEEVCRLEELGIRDNRSASQAIGYRQALDYLMTSRNKNDYAQFMERFKQASRNYAKRQFTWFRKEQGFRWLDLDMHDWEVALEMVIQDYQSR